MTVTVTRISSRTGRLLALAVAVGVLAALGAARPAHAYGETFWMIRNQAYDKCLSKNVQTPPGGAGTHLVYLTTCNPGSYRQWWQVVDINGDFQQLKNWVKDSGTTWDLSANGSTPPGGVAGTHSVYAAAASDTASHRWFVGGNSRSTVMFENQVQYELDGKPVRWYMSASHNSPYQDGGYRVYTSRWRPDPPTAQFWTVYRPANTFAPKCDICINL